MHGKWHISPFHDTTMKTIHSKTTSSQETRLQKNCMPFCMIKKVSSNLEKPAKTCTFSLENNPGRLYAKLKTSSTIVDLFWQDLFKAPSNYAYSFLDKENNGKTIECLWDCGSSFYIRGAPLSYKLHESVFIRANLTCKRSQTCTCYSSNEF